MENLHFALVYLFTLYDYPFLDVCERRTNTGAVNFQEDLFYDQD